VHHQQHRDNDMQISQHCFQSIFSGWLPLIAGLAVRLLALTANIPLLLCPNTATAQANLKTVVENPRGAAVLLSPLANGPGFTLRNVSQRPVTQVQLGCVAPGSAENPPTKVRYRMVKQPLALEPSGAGSEQIFEGYRPEQSICGHQGSAITVLEVAFESGKKWQLPHQVRDNHYTYDKAEGTSVIR